MSVSLNSEKKRGKVLAAIVAGVTACIEEDERALEAVSRGQRPSLAINVWSVLGREEIMRMRTLWQRRMV